jgi:ribosomal protein L11 methyltransferase
VDKQTWLEVSFILPGEQAEVVAEILNRYAHQGVVIERDLQTREKNQMKVFAYLPEDDTLDHNKQEIEKAIFYLDKILPVPAPTYRQIRDEDWMASWKKFYQPVEIGQQLIIIPAWFEMKEKINRIPIRVNPGLAFGTGTHPTTQLSLELLEKYVQPGMEMIDVGCGSGILSIAGILLGASHAIAVDISEAALLSTVENIAINGVQDKVESGLASVREIRAGNFSSQKAPLVVANILLKILEDLFDLGLGELVCIDGHLLISGILNDQVDEIEKKALANGFTRVEQITQIDWSALAFRKNLI